MVFDHDLLNGSMVSDHGSLVDHGSSWSTVVSFVWGIKEGRKHEVNIGPLCSQYKMPVVGFHLQSILIIISSWSKLRTQPAPF